MTYTVTFTDSTNPSKPPITVADGALNNQTSLTFPGKNYAGYGPVIAGDFLHLLENFANSTSPSNPVQGQLWYDTSDNILKVYDGTTWNEAGNLKKSSTAPSVSSSVTGDLWVDTTNDQLFLFSGAQWLLVGPQYSSGLVSGPVVETIIDTQNISHAVVSIYVASSVDNSSYRVAIISKDSFIPKLAVTGYTTINEGLNLYLNSKTGDVATIWGTASVASNLLVGSATVPAANFLRSDAVSTTNNTFNIRNANGLSIGTDLSLNISQGSGNFSITSKNTNNNLEFNVGGEILMHLDSEGVVGIGANVINPTTTLTVGGTITSGYPGYPGGLIINDGASPTPNALFSATSSGITTSLNATLSGNITLGNGIVINTTVTNGTVILPPATSSTLFDIGRSDRPFRNIYADSFVGAFTGTFVGSVTGSVTGTADSLKNSTTFLLAGDIQTPPSDGGTSFNGLTTNGQAILNTQLNPAVITSKTLATSSLATDKLLVYQTTTSGSGLVQMTKQTFLQGVGAFAIPIGGIMPFAGLKTNIPDGWLMCDGSEISTSVYNALFAVIGYTYGAANTLKGTGTFALPDMRGRFPLGLDNMNNYGNVNGFTQATTGTPPVAVNTGGQIGAAGRVANVAADNLGGYGGSQNVVLSTSNLPQHSHSLTSSNGDDYYAPGPYGGSPDTSAQYGYGIPVTGNTGYGITNTGNVNAGTVGQAVTVMNPYLSVNYIIFTGNI